MKDKLAARRQVWRGRKGLTIRDFAESTNNYYGTVRLWFKVDRFIRKKYLDSVLNVHPDFPI